MNEILLWIAVGFGFYMAWNIGANDVANAMGTSVGSRALTFMRAIIYAAIFEFLGALLVGSHVTDTVRKGIIDASTFEGSKETFVLGMTAALLGAAAWLNITSAFGQPESTTHSIVGAIFGFGLIVGGTEAVNWGVIAKIAISWVSAPLFGGLIGYFLFRFISRRILAVESPSRAVQRIAPLLLFAVASILALSMLWKGLKNLKLDYSLPEALGLAALAGIVVALVGSLLLRRIHRVRVKDGLEEELWYVESIFRRLQVVTACYVAFAHGANDVANAVGPLAAVATVVKTGALPTGANPVPTWILLLGAVGIVVGLATFGRRVMETVGRKITEMTPSRGFTAEFAAATTVLICSRMGVPVSTTHTLVGAVIGVALARGIAALNMRVVRVIATTWVVTIPVAASFTLVFYFILKGLFLH
ncbi:MAG: inorganic phosphate transporter [Planctomycetota bacterium]